MAVTIPNSLGQDLATGAVNLGSDTFYGVLLDATFTPNAATQAKRSDLSGEVSGTGYTAGGAALSSVAVTRSGATTKWTSAALVWSGATITARYLAICKHRGGAATADELILIDDFGSNQSSSGGTWTYTPNAAGLLTLS